MAGFQASINGWFCLSTGEFAYGNTLRSPAGEFPFVSRMTIRDVTGSGAVTRILFEAPRPETHPVSMFNINNVVR